MSNEPSQDIESLEERLLELELENRRLKQDLRRYGRKQNKVDQVARLSKLAYWELNLVTRRLVPSPELCELLGAECAEVTSWRELLAFVPPNDRVRIGSLFESALVNGRDIDIEHQFSAPNGETLHVRHLWKSYFSDDGTLPVLAVGLVQDVTEHHLTKVHLQRAKDSAEAASKAKSAFVANVSHELRTPMNGILGMTEILLGTELDGDQQDLIRATRDSATSLLAIINDILDFSRIEANRIDILPVTFSLTGLLTRLSTSQKAIASGKGVDFQLITSPGLPPHVFGDEIRLQQVLINLLSNAIKFTDAGGTVTLRARRSRSFGEDHIAFAVEDTGIGIPTDKLKTIFMEFSQGDASTTRKYGGTGLGLAISSRLVKLMDGTLEVRSELDLGSVFYFSIPLPKRDAPEVENEDPPQEPDRSLSILLAEDNVINQRVAVRFLEKAGHRVAVAADGLKVVEAFKAGDYDLILMDIQMPLLDGDEAMRIIRTCPGGGDIPVIAVTANAMQNDRDRFLAAGFDGYLSKPYSSRNLISAITSLRRQLSPTLSQP